MRSLCDNRLVVQEILTKEIFLINSLRYVRKDLKKRERIDPLAEEVSGGKSPKGGVKGRGF